MILGTSWQEEHALTSTYVLLISKCFPGSSLWWERVSTGTPCVPSASRLSKATPLGARDSPAHGDRGPLHKGARGSQAPATTSPSWQSDGLGPGSTLTEEARAPTCLGCPLRSTVRGSGLPCIRGCLGASGDASHLWREPCDSPRATAWAPFVKGDPPALQGHYGWGQAAQG